MPVEIRELIIRVAIDKYQQEHTVTPQMIQQLKNEVVQECTTRIVQKLKKNHER